MYNSPNFNPFQAKKAAGGSLRPENTTRDRENPYPGIQGAKLLRRLRLLLTVIFMKLTPFFLNFPKS